MGVISVIPSGTDLFPFMPVTTGAWLLSARPVISGRTMSFGPAVEVNAGTALPLPAFASWAAGFELASRLPSGTLSTASDSDYNKDGVPDLIAYALGLSPVIASAGQLPRALAVQGTLRLDYPRDTTKTDITLTPQVSNDLRSWFTPGQTGAPSGFLDLSLSTAGSIETRRATAAITHGGPRYLRLRVMKN